MCERVPGCLCADRGAAPESSSATWPTSSSPTRSAATRLRGSVGCAAALERLTYRDDRAAGALHVAILLGAVALSGATVQRGARRGPALAAATAAATWVTLGGTTLARTGTRMAELRLGRRLRRRPRVVAVTVRPGSLGARRRRPGPRGAGVGGREHLGRPRRSAVVGGGRGSARCPGVSRGQHTRRDDRQPVAALCTIRLGCSTFGRRCQLCRRPGGRRAGGGLRPAGRRVTGWRVAGLATRCRAPSQPERGSGGSRLRRGTGCAARRPHAVPPRVGDPAHPG